MSPRDGVSGKAVSVRIPSPCAPIPPQDLLGGGIYYYKMSVRHDDKGVGKTQGEGNGKWGKALLHARYVCNTYYV